MNQVRRALLKCSNHFSESSLKTHPKFFSTLPPQQQHQQPGPLAFNNFSLPPNQQQQQQPSGFIYGRITNITKHTTKTDMVSLLEGSGVKPHNIKVEYSRHYTPLSMIVEFEYRSSYDAAGRSIGKKGRMYTLSRAERAEWDAVSPFDGKSILIQELPSNALMDDVIRFLSGCQYHPNSIQIFLRQTNGSPVRMGLVQFPSQVLATHAYVTKNGGFCLNNKISLLLLH